MAKLCTQSRKATRGIFANMYKFIYDWLRIFCITIFGNTMKSNIIIITVILLLFTGAILINI